MTTLLVTGGTGFFGRRLGRALGASYKVVLAGRNHEQNRVAEEFSGCAVRAIDVTSIESVRDAFVDVRPDVVVHAAASKYVDIAERLPLECIDVNVVGSENVARVAAERGVRAVIGVSTDKAAPPVANTYGLTKALMERLYCAMDGSGGTRFACVRFGNLPWSTGSFLPAWKRMHESTGVIGTTGPEMTRLFTPVDHAIGLVRAAIEHVEVFAGAVVARESKTALIGHILDLWLRHRGGASERLAGRPGERPYETLIAETELPYTSEIVLDGVRYFALRFNRRAERALAAPITSDNAPKFSDGELLAILDSAPSDVA